MAQIALHFVDPSIPGISGRDLVERAVSAVQTSLGETRRGYQANRKDFAMRKDLSRLDRAQLRDIGIDRNSL